LEGKSAFDQVKILKDELTRQRRANLELERQLKQFKKLSGNKEREKMQAEIDRITQEKEQLEEELQKSEGVRGKQKDLIDSLKRDLMGHKRKMEEKKHEVSDQASASHRNHPIINIESASNGPRHA
jgi:predicted  nucleic acid-binding Zn-ribbon protein